MGLFQALLLAASLGCSAVLAAPQDYPGPSNSTTPDDQLPHNGLTTTNSPINTPSASPNNHNDNPTVSYPFAQSSPSYPNQQGPPTNGPPPQGPPTTGSNHPWGPPTTATTPNHPTPWPASSSPNPSPASSSGAAGILIDTSPSPTAIGTYFVEGRPIIAGASATVVMGTTWSLAGPGMLYADGTPTRVSDAIVVAGTGTSTVEGGGTSGRAGGNAAGVASSAGASGSGVGGERMVGAAAAGGRVEVGLVGAMVVLGGALVV